MTSEGFVLCSQGPETNLKCLEGHDIRLFPAGTRKLRKDARGRVSQPAFQSFICKSCRNNTALTDKGFFSCSDKCDFDLCHSCVTCAIDGNILCETYELPSQDTIKWQQLQTNENYFDGST